VEPILTTLFTTSTTLFFFEAVSGLKVNMTKLMLVPVGNVDNTVELVAY
jgi:hypothetical protein